MKLFKTEWLAVIIVVGVLCFCGIYTYRLSPQPEHFTVVGSHQEKEAPSYAPRVFVPDKILDLNTATYVELITLNGIGDTKARAILQYRKNNGPFSATEDLMKIPGIGQATYDKLAPYITVLPPED